jgi:hypothetical protein
MSQLKSWFGDLGASLVARIRNWLVEGFINDDEQWDVWAAQVVSIVTNSASKYVPELLANVREALADLLLGVPLETQEPEEEIE